MASAADVPGKYDLFISDGTNSQGFVLLDAFKSDANVPEKAIHSFSPTFVPRQNVEGNYGDDSQEFFMTYSQKDWSLGEEQKYQSRGNEPKRRYWRGSAVDVSVLGEVKIEKALTTIDSGAADNLELGIAPGNSALFWYWNDANGNIWRYNTSTGAETDMISGTAVTADAECVAFDGNQLYFSSEAGSVQEWDLAASAVTTFSATGASALVHLNNALYGLRTIAGTLVRYSTAGVATVLHTWRDSIGSVVAGALNLIEPFGGKLLITTINKGARGSELWVYDGVGVSLLHQWSSGFLPYSMCTSNGVVYFAGVESRRGCVYYYANGQVGLLWRSRKATVTGEEVQVAAFGNGVIFTERATGDTTTRVLLYSPETGGVSTIAEPSLSINAQLSANAQGWFLLVRLGDDIIAYRPYAAATATTATVTSSLIDFDSSLEKFFRGIEIDYDEATTGDGGSVDIAYRLNDLDSTYTTLQTGAVAGTEYILGGVGTEVEGRSISIRITLNKGTSTLGPVLKRIFVRAAPRVNSFHRSKATLNLAGRNGDDHVRLRDESLEPLDGLALAHKLKEFTQVDGLLNITDKFGTRVSTIESLEMVEIRPEEFVANLVFRQV